MSGLYQMPPLQAVAAADLSAKQYHLIVINTSGTMELAGAGVRPDGILMDAPTAGKTGTYETLHGQRATVIAGAAVTVGALASVEATSARAVISATTGHKTFGKFLSAGGDGEEVTVLLGVYPDVP